MSGRPGLVSVSTSSLERIRDGLHTKRLAAPITRARLIAFGIKEQIPSLVSVFEGHSRLACLSIVDTALAERANARQPRPELVWTGPESPQASARDTAVLLRELFRGARRHVILAGYSFSAAERVLEPLHDVMVRHGVRAEFFVNIEQASEQTEQGESYGQEQLTSFFKANWPFGRPYPNLYCDRRALRPRPYVSLHAKCVTIDSRRAFISSANFTTSGQFYNIEAGVVLHDPTFAAQLDRQWLSLIEEDLVLRWQA